MKDRVILFGASGLLNKVYYYLKNEFNILCICDNNEKKLGNDLFGLKIIAPINLKEYQYDKIIITSSYYEDIKAQLVFLNIGLEKLFYIEMYEKINNYNFNVSFKIKKMEMCNDIALTDKYFLELIDKKFIDIKKSQICGIRINDNDLKILKSKLKKYFNGKEEVENISMSVRDIVDFIYINKFNVIECLYNLDNKFLMNKILKFISILSNMISNKNLIIYMIEEVFKDKSLTFVEKAHYYSMLSCADGGIREYKQGYENVIIEFSN